MELRERGQSLGLLILRVGIGALMLSHGWGKVQMVMAGEFDKFGDPIGIGSHASLLLVAAAEFIGAICVILGLLTRLAALALVVSMGVAVFFAHRADPWTLDTAVSHFFSGETRVRISQEPALLYLIPFLALTVAGPGALSFDRIFRLRPVGGTPAKA
jgi:putative oxidoreductase